MADALTQKTGDALVKYGYAQVSLGDFDAGTKLIEQGIAKGGLRFPEDGKLRLGMAQLQNPKTKTEDFMELAQLALQAGLPTEARRIADQGFKTGVLGTGPEAARHQRLRDLTVKQEGEAKTNLPSQVADALTQKTGDALVKYGYAQVSLGDFDAGTKLIEQGIAKGGLRFPEDGKLRLGMAQLQNPKTKAAAVQTLRSVKGSDGAADVARLWVILGNP